MKVIIKNMIVALLLAGTIASTFSGCASSSYSKGFDEAD